MKPLINYYIVIVLILTLFLVTIVRAIQVKELEEKGIQKLTLLFLKFITYFALGFDELLQILKTQCKRSHSIRNEALELVLEELSLDPTSKIEEGDYSRDIIYFSSLAKKKSYIIQHDIAENALLLDPSKRNILSNIRYNVKFNLCYIGVFLLIAFYGYINIVSLKKKD